MENNENPFNSEFFNTEENNTTAKELQKPIKKRKGPLTVGATFTIIGAIVFFIYVFFMITNYNILASGDASSLLAIITLPIAIFAGIVSCVLNLVGLINSIFAIRSDIPKVKTWGIALTVITSILIVGIIALFLVILIL